MGDYQSEPFQSEPVQSKTHRHSMAFLLGLDGAALLRAFAGDGGDEEFVNARYDEIRTILAHAADFGTGDEAAEVTTVLGYQGWAESYDEPGGGCGLQGPARGDDLAFSTRGLADC